MRPSAILRAFALLPARLVLAPLVLAPLALASSALAQVTVDLHALQALPQRPANPVVRLPRAAPNRAPAAPQTASLSSQAGQPRSTVAPGASPGTPSAPQASTGTPPAPPAPSPALPEQAPQTASVTPIEPPQASAAPPPPTVSATAGTAAAPISAGLRLTFATGQSDLNPDSAASIKQFATSATAGGTATFNVQAYAPGDKDDPSSARRLSLARAMTVRTALVADGVPSARIFVRALGAQYGSGPPDRVDIDMASDNAAAAR